MIASLRGILLEKSSDSVIVEAGGVGYAVLVTRQALAGLGDVGESCFLLTHLHIREDAQQLFGFGDAVERRAFLLLLGVKGVGPKLGLSMLSALAPAGLFEAVGRVDLPALTALSGVGKKLAERLIVELKDKAPEFAAGNRVAGGARVVSGIAEPGDQAVLALQNLGYSTQLANRAVAEAHKILGSGEHRLEDIVKTALKVV